MVLLNNDLSAGVPDILKNLEQTVLPPLYAGWTTRRKSQHFAAYDKVAQEFADLIGIDPWLIDPLFGVCGKIDFHERAGEECLASNVAFLLDRIKAITVTMTFIRVFMSHLLFNFNGFLLPRTKPSPAP